MVLGTKVVPPRGPVPADLAIVGEAPGEQEETYGKPFIGSAGTELATMMKEAGLSPPSVYFTNVFKVRPEKNNVDHFFVPKKLGDPQLPPLRAGKYLPVEHKHYLTSLGEELANVRPKLILALGNTALWALTGLSGITKYRGVLQDTPYGTVLPSLHPAAILRSWASRPIAIADLAKARDFLSGSLSVPRADEHELYLNPTLSDLPRFRRMVEGAPRLGVDVETSRGQITMIGFATSTRSGFCIPFWDPDTCLSYWPTLEMEVEARQFCAWALKTPIPKVGQNFLYDLQYFISEHFLVRGVDEDTILLHHALQPEMQKSLGFMASVYLNQSAWKELRHRRGDEIVKKDE